ncbi:MAG: hypothetical protein R1F52_06635 [Candidatus Nitrosoabyssus spongiisocia]|nr:MAG: hypothetical protein R1F52_06635 [Nitrosopumilaceae archaeon AB1(1)]
MEFVRRDIILIAGVFLFMLGLIQVMHPIYAAIIAIVIYFGIKVYVGKSKSYLLEKTRGKCLVCGETLIDDKCKECDKSNIV